MATRLLFEVTHKGEQKSYDQTQKKLGSVTLAPIYYGMLPEDDPMRDEIKSFYAATPSGEIKFATINERALAEFEIGRRFYVTLEAAPES